MKKVCNACHEDLDKESYSKKQWNARQRRRCKGCVVTCRPVSSMTPRESELSRSCSNPNVKARTRQLTLPGPEMQTDTNARILSYRYMTGPKDVILEVFEEFSKLGLMWHMRRIDTDTMEPTDEEVAFKEPGTSGCGFEFNMDPDYDRNAAEYPLFGQQNLGRRRREGTPTITTFFDFIVSQCGDIATKPELIDEIESQYGEKYRGDMFLVIFLSVVKVVLGGYSFDGGPRDSGVKSLVSAMENHFAKEEKWQEMVATFSFLVEQALDLKSSLRRTCLMEEMTAVGLEGCGLHSQAAMLYTEAGRHLNDWKHPKAAGVHFRAGRAWMRHGDLDVAEQCFVHALQALRFEFDHIQYKASASSILGGLIEIYASVSPSLAAALYALLEGAEVSNLPDKPEVEDCSLISEYSSGRKKSRRALQYVIVEATSVVQLRTSIESFIASSGGITPERSITLCQDPDEYDDDDLFRETAPDECAVCFLPIPHGKGNVTERVHKMCCGQDICKGCVHAMCEMKQQEAPCPFCRATILEKDYLDRCRQRAEQKDGDAMYLLGTFYQHGQYGLARNEVKADRMFEEAAELGSNCARIFVAIKYLAAKPPRVDRARHLLSLATIDGDSYARFSLGRIEFESGNVKRATMHWLIAAKNGNKNALECLQSCFKKGFASITKQDFETAIRAFYEMRKTMKSEQREAAAAAGYC